MMQASVTGCVLVVALLSLTTEAVPWGYPYRYYPYYYSHNPEMISCQPIATRHKASTRGRSRGKRMYPMAGSLFLQQLRNVDLPDYGCWCSSYRRCTESRTEYTPYPPGPACGGGNTLGSPTYDGPVCCCFTYVSYK